ncbi:MAG: hypothetical protein LRY50_02095 [Geovibrio sp.]|nr:hypothetical protein [Geovibrio sp.]
MKVIYAKGTQEEIATAIYGQIAHRETLDYFMDFPRKVLGGTSRQQPSGEYGALRPEKAYGCHFIQV